MLPSINGSFFASARRLGRAIGPRIFSPSDRGIEAGGPAHRIRLVPLPRWWAMTQHRQRELSSSGDCASQESPGVPVSAKRSDTGESRDDGQRDEHDRQPARMHGASAQPQRALELEPSCKHNYQPDHVRWTRPMPVIQPEQLTAAQQVLRQGSDQRHAGPRRYKANSDGASQGHRPIRRVRPISFASRAETDIWCWSTRHRRQSTGR
jgi:hypothetical protein